MSRKIGTQVFAEINRARFALVKKAKEKGLYENFGQVEVEKIKDKFNYSSLIYGTFEERAAGSLIAGFDSWCYNFDLSQIKN